MSFSPCVRSRFVVGARRLPVALAAFAGLSGLGLSACEPAPVTPVTIGEKIKSKHGTTGGIEDGSRVGAGDTGGDPTNLQLGKLEGSGMAPHGAHSRTGESPYAALAKDKVILIVDGESFSKGDLDRSLAQAAGLAGVPPNLIDAQMRSAFEAPAYEKLIERALLTKEARARKLWPSDAETKKKREEMIKTLPEGKTLADILVMMGADEASFDNDLKIDLAIASLLKSLEKDQPAPTEAMVGAIYEKNKGVFTIPDSAAAAHILVKVDRAAGADVLKEKKAEADAILKSVKGKDAATFAQVAKEKSQDPSGPARGGDIGIFKRGDLFPEFEAVAFKLKEGDIAGPVLTERGYHIIRSGGVEKGRTIPRAEALKVVRERERVKGFMDAVDNLVEKLRQNAKIERIVAPAASPLMDPAARGLRVPSWRANGKNAMPGMTNPHEN